MIRTQLRESGGGGSKKDAKREAAQKMIDKLKSMGPNNGPAQVLQQSKTVFIISAKQRLAI